MEIQNVDYRVQSIVNITTRLLELYQNQVLTADAIMLWLFFKEHNKQVLSLVEILKHTHVRRTTVVKYIKQLIKLHMLSKVRNANEHANAYHVKPSKTWVTPIARSARDTTVPLLIGPIIYTSSITTNSNTTTDITGPLKGETEVSVSDRTLKDVKSTKDIQHLCKYKRVSEIYADECWNDIEKVLLQFFPRSDTRPGNGLTRSGRYRKLRTLFLDDEIDFEKYCIFYDAKGKGFTYGFFLYPTMRDEFIRTYGTEDDYLRTTSKDKDKKQAEADQSKADIRKLLGGV